MPSTAAFLTTPVNWLVRFRDAFLRLTWTRAAVAALFLVAFTYVADVRSKQYYSEFSMPPSFRHMDQSSVRQVIVDYLDAQRAGPDTLLVLGDCVAFGHGVKRAFSSYLEVPGLRVVNISMQSFRYDLMLLTIDEAHRRGVEHVLVQLHPFEDYAFETRVWEALASVEPRAHAQTDFVQQAEKNWRFLAIAMSGDSFSFYEVPRWTLWTGFSSLLRVSLLGNWTLSRDRFAIDDWSNLDVSYFTSRTNRIDSYAKRLPPERQVEILKDEAWLWPLFQVPDPEAYKSIVADHSAPARLAKVMRERQMKAVFVWAPTFVDLLEQHTVLKRSDLVSAAESIRDVVSASGYPFVDLLEDRELSAEMMHYDNLTVAGQKLMAEKLNAVLPELFGHE